jgi:hypothetical protein
VVSYSEEVEFFGHEMIKATHKTTIEVTRDDFLTPRGDCIIGVEANKALSDLSKKLKSLISSNFIPIIITFEVNGDSFKVRARGNSKLSLLDKSDIVIRKSTYICDRTLAVMADAAAIDLPRSIVENLRDPNCRGKMRIEVEER